MVLYQALVILLELLKGQNSMKTKKYLDSLHKDDHLGCGDDEGHCGDQDHGEREQGKELG